MSAVAFVLPYRHFLQRQLTEDSKRKNDSAARAGIAVRKGLVSWEEWPSG
jgi:hypothetical protein